MASTTQDELYRVFLAVSGQQTSAIGDTNAMLADVIAQLSEARSSVPAAAAAPASGTKTTTQATSNDGWTTVGSVASTVLKNGFGLAPLISGLVGLFSGGAAEAPAPLVKYAMPAAIDFQAAESGGRMTALEYDQAGMPRSYAGAAQSGGTNVPVDGRVTGPAYDQTGMTRSYAEVALSAGASVNVNGQVSGQDYYQPGMPQSPAEAAASGGARATASGAAPQITVNVQAMDARSFMDRSNDIALAVRDAMLNLNAINDVVNEL